MYPRGIIYQKGKSENRGVITLHAPLSARIGYSLFRGFGTGLIGFAVMAFVFTFGPPIREEIGYQLSNKGNDSTASFGQDVHLAEALRVSEVQEEATNLGLDSYFSLNIPKINAKSKIIPNVEVNNSKEYLASLQKGVAHAKGTYFPGQGNLVYLFAHSTDSPVNFSRYNAVFYLLGKLEKGDRLTVYFADKKYVYEVKDKVITKGTDTSWLTKKYAKETLILQTCDPPGTTWNRLLVIAEPVLEVN